MKEMGDLIGKIISSVFSRESTRYVFAIGVTASAMLLLPEDIAVILGINDLRITYRFLIGLVAFIATIYSLVLFSLDFISWESGKIKSWWRRRQIMAQLHTLTLVERRLLRDNYIKRETQTAPFKEGDGVVNGLIAKGILYRSSNIGKFGGRPFEWDYNIYPQLYNYLVNHPELLDDGKSV